MTKSAKTYFVDIASILRTKQHVHPALVEREQLPVHRVFLYLDLRLPYDLSRLTETSLAQLTIFAERADIRKIIGQLDINNRTRMTIEIINDLVPPHIVYQHIAVGQSGDE